MTRQIALGYDVPRPADLEHRIHVLEARVAGLTAAVALLARAVEAGSQAGPDDDDAAALAVHQAHEIITELGGGHGPVKTRR